MNSRILTLSFYGAILGLHLCFAHAASTPQCTGAQECTNIAEVCNKLSLTYHCVDTQCCCLSYAQKKCINPYTDLNNLLHNHHTGCGSIEECAFLSTVCRNVSLKSHCYDEKCCCFSFDQHTCVDPSSVLKLAATTDQTTSTNKQTMTMFTPVNITATVSTRHTKASSPLKSTTPSGITHNVSISASKISKVPSVSASRTKTSSIKYTTIPTNTNPIRTVIQPTNTHNITKDRTSASSMVSASATKLSAVTGTTGKHSSAKTTRTTVKPTLTASESNAFSKQPSSSPVSLNTQLITIPMMTTNVVSAISTSAAFMPTNHSLPTNPSLPMNNTLHNTLSQKSAHCNADSDCNRENTWVKLIFADIKCTKSDASTECINGRCYCILNPPTIAPTQGGHSCYQCGDLTTQSPCNEQAFLYGQSSPCNAGDFCQTDVFTFNNNDKKIYKRCVDESTCVKEWLQKTSDREYCIKYGSVKGPDKFVCSFCCVGRGCNPGFIPPSNILYGSNPV